jgi:hypothetical protein
MSQIKTMIFLLLATPALASPTNPYATQNTLSALPQDSTVTSPTFLSIPTITFDILQPPYVSLYSLAARDEQQSHLTSTITTITTEIPTSTIATFAPLTTTSSSALALQSGTEDSVATPSSALHSGTEVSAPTSSSDRHSETEASAATSSSVQHKGTTASPVQQTGMGVPVVTPTDRGHAPTTTVKKPEWDCTALCGEIDKDRECTYTEGCVKIEDGSGKVKGMKPPHASSASSSGVFRERAGAVLMLVVLVGMLL